MQPYQIRRAAIILLGIILIVFIAVQGVRFIARVGNDQPQPPDELAEELILPDYDTRDSAVQLIYSGPIEAREEYHQIRMRISADQRRLEMISGYSEDVVRRRVLGNSQAAYGTFLRALYLNDFANARTSELGDDERGVCFRGQRIVGQLFDGDEQVLRLWAASCDYKIGTMDARWRDILTLFQRQFPDYPVATKGIGF